VHAPGRDEIGALGRAFDRVQHTAVQLVERQVASRRNVALMFGYLGRRTQNLVSRQIALIDQLERDETDPLRLSELYRLDHISSRLRRNAGSLAALSGTVGADEHVAPLPLAALAVGGEGSVQVPLMLLGTAFEVDASNRPLLLLAGVGWWRGGGRGGGRGAGAGGGPRGGARGAARGGPGAAPAPGGGAPGGGWGGAPPRPCSRSSRSASGSASTSRWSCSTRPSSATCCGATSVPPRVIGFPSCKGFWSGCP
jgi:hypothetical protein